MGLDVTVLQAKHTATWHAFAYHVIQNELETGQDIRMLKSDWLKNREGYFKYPFPENLISYPVLQANMQISCLKDFASRTDSCTGTSRIAKDTL